MSTPLTNLIPPERFKSWSVIAPSRLQFFEDQIIVTWTEDALENPIQPLQLHIHLECCDSGNSNYRKFLLQTMVKKKGKWAIRNQWVALLQDDPLGQTLINTEFCDDFNPDPGPCDVPTSPGTMSTLEFENQVDQWIAQSTVIEGVKYTFKHFDIEWEGCGSSRCPTPGLYAQYYEGEDVIYQLKIYDAAPDDYGEKSLEWLCEAGLLNESMLAFGASEAYNLDPSGQYSDWNINISCGQFTVTYDGGSSGYGGEPEGGAGYGGGLGWTERGVYYWCPRECPQGTTWNPVIKKCQTSCPPGFIANDDGVCTNFDGIEVPESGVPVWIRYRRPAGGVDVYNVAIGYDNNVDLQCIESDGPNPSIFDADPQNGWFGDPPGNFAYQWFPMLEELPLVMSVTSRQITFTGTPNTVADLSKCGMPMFYLLQETVHTVYLNGESGYHAGPIDQYEFTGESCTPGFPSDSDIYRPFLVQLNEFRPIEYDILIDGEVIFSYKTPGQAPQAQAPWIDGVCTYCAIPQIHLVLEIPISIYIQLQGLPKDYILTYFMRIPLGSFTLPRVCVKGPDMDIRLFNIISQVAEEGLSMVVDTGIDAIISFFFPGWGTILSKFVNWEVDVSWDKNCVGS